MSGDHDKYHGTAEVVKDGGVYLTREEMAELADAIDETLYLLSPTDKDMQDKQGIYRVFTAFYKFINQTALKIKKNHGVAPKREWVGLTDDDRKQLADVIRFNNIWYLEDMLRAAEETLRERNSAVKDGVLDRKELMKTDRELVADLILEKSGQIVGTLHQDVRKDISFFNVKYDDGKVYMVKIIRTEGEWLELDT